MSNTENELSEVEIVKSNSDFLRGKIKEGLETNISTYEEEEKQLLKFHGLYQQKSRDRIKNEKGDPVEQPTTFMLRGRIPGGILTKEQYLMWDSLADRFAGNALRLTTRQSIQLHSLMIHDLKAVMQDINKINQTTKGACGDVVRNVTQAINPKGKKELELLDEPAKLISEHFEYTTSAYVEIWLDGEQVNKEKTERIYGKTYLPRKFKIGITLAGDNTIDLYTNDMGFAATLNAEKNKIDGYFVFAGGGLGMTHNKPETFPRVADLLGWFPAEHLISVSEAIVIIHRDYGDRTNRKHARLKYVLHDKGVDWFRAEVEKRANLKLDVKKALPKWETPTYLGWSEREDGTLALGFHTLAGRIKDFKDRPIKSALRELIEKYCPKVQVTADQDILLLGIKKENKKHVEDLLNKYKISYASPKKLYDYALACPALPTCSLALTEAERFFPEILSSVQKLIDQYDLNERAPVLRMTGCPNGCARPYSAEIGIVGQAAGGKYALFLGGNKEGTKVGEYVATKIPKDEIPSYLDKLFQVWKNESNGKELLGDFVNRTGIEKVKNIFKAE